jgi:hypothetical protein
MKSAWIIDTYAELLLLLRWLETADSTTLGNSPAAFATESDNQFIQLVPYYAELPRL